MFTFFNYYGAIISKRLTDKASEQCEKWVKEVQDGAHGVNSKALAK